MSDKFSSLNTLENDWLLQQEPFETLIMKRLSPMFEWLDLFPKMRLNDSDSISWPKEQYSASSDPNKRFPRRRTSGADFTRVKASKLTSGQATLAQWGFEFAVDEKARRYKKNLDVLVRSLTRNATWLGEWENALIISNVVDETNGVQRITSGMDFYKRQKVAWGSDGYNPIKDLLLFKYDFEDANTGYKGTDFYLNKKSYRLLNEYITGINVDMETRKALYGTPVAGQGTLFIPQVNATVHEVSYGLVEGDLLALDRNMTPFTIYYDWNPEYGPAESFTMENGQVLDNNFGLHTHEYKTDKNHEFIKQLWLDNAIAIKDSSGGMFVPAGTYGI